MCSLHRKRVQCSEVHYYGVKFSEVHYTVQWGRVKCKWSTVWITASDAKQKNTFFCLIKNFFLKKKTSSKKLFFMFFYYYLQFKGRKVFFNTLECLFMLYTSCKILHSVCQLHFHWVRDKLLNPLAGHLAYIYNFIKFMCLCYKTTCYKVILLIKVFQ